MNKSIFILAGILVGNATTSLAQEITVMATGAAGSSALGVAAFPGWAAGGAI